MGGMEEIKVIYEKGGFDIGERKYTFAKMPFKLGKKVFAYMTKVAEDLEAGNLEFIDTPKFENDIEPLLMKYTMVGGFKVDTIVNHFDEHPGDYVQFVMMSIQGFAAPFLPESATGSSSTQPESQTVTLKKPM